MINILYLLLFSNCINIDLIEKNEHGVCIGQRKDSNQFFCYYGSSVKEEECLEFGYSEDKSLPVLGYGFESNFINSEESQGKSDFEFIYNRYVECYEFCEEIWEMMTYGSDLECNVINLDEDSD